MTPFAFERIGESGAPWGVDSNPESGHIDTKTQFLAGGTTLLDLMKLDVLHPERVVDLAPLQHRYGLIQADDDGLRLGALAKMSNVAAHPQVRNEYPAIAQSLELAASAQLRNMATLGGNVLQKTRCTYFRDPSWTACNKRHPGSGCAALRGFNRNHAVLGVDASCIAQYPGDFAVALVALEAQVNLDGPQGPRRMPISSLHVPANGTPHIETALRPGELITGFFVPRAAWNRRSLFVKVRDRASYEFALAATAVALELDGDRVHQVRIGLGGIAYRPWRAIEAEQVLRGRALTPANAEAAAAAALANARTHGDNDYKPELARRTLVRALMQARSMSPAPGA